MSTPLGVQSENSKVNNWDPDVHLTYLLGAEKVATSFVKQSGPLRMDVPGRKLGSVLWKWVISLINGVYWG